MLWLLNAKINASPIHMTHDSRHRNSTPQLVWHSLYYIADGNYIVHRPATTIANFMKCDFNLSKRQQRQQYQQLQQQQQNSHSGCLLADLLKRYFPFRSLYTKLHRWSDWKSLFLPIQPPFDMMPITLFSGTIRSRAILVNFNLSHKMIAIAVTYDFN